jgi:Skp family chaperone for outer membrane proteins
LIPPPQAFAEEIYVVNIQEVIAKSAAGESLKKKMEAEALKRRSQIDLASQEILADEEKLQKQASLLAPSILQEKQDALAQRRKELARKVQDEKESLERQSGQAIAKLVGKIREMIPQVVKDDPASIVMERDPQVVLYASPSRDITAQLIDLLNETVVSL